MGTAPRIGAVPMFFFCAELPKNGQSRALPLRPIGGITELPKNGRPHRVAPTHDWAAEMRELRTN